MIRKTCVLWKRLLPAVCPETSEPIFKVHKRIVWDESSEQQLSSEPETSSGIQLIEEQAEDLVDLNNTNPKTLAEANILNQLRIKKLREALQHFDEERGHENFFKRFSEKWNLKMELRKANSVRLQDQIVYTKEMLTNLDRSAATLYFDCANRFPYLKLCSALCLPDYLSTWYKLTLMHTWNSISLDYLRMLLVRLQSVLEAAAFIRLRNSVIEIMFCDIDKRLRIASEELHEMLYHKSDKRRMAGLYLQTFFEYDEGFLSDDTTLAEALWRNLYMQRSVDPIHLNRAVYYIRGTMSYLDSLSLEEILLEGIKNWKTARPDVKFNDKNAFDLAEDVAHSLLKRKYKHT
uniref:Ubiquinol-cytochrome c chaperone domain-containing protein n=1 Tax=Setaria digitata TaxID=48799 RepID=A0A915PMX5_9BILA